MKSDFLLAITQLSAEKNLPKEVVINAIETALVSAYRKENFAVDQNLSVKINPNSGKVEVWAEKTVVKKPADVSREISLAEAAKFKKDAKTGDLIMVEATPQNAGRIAAQTAKQVILQRLHEAEHSAIFEEYTNKEGEVVTGIVQRTEPSQMIVDLGRTEAVLPISEQIRNERYRPGQRLKTLILEVRQASVGPQVILSRSHPEFLRRLFELEVPEVFNGAVEIKAIAREAGFRSKVAVAARQEGIDPVGCCVGLRGIRIQNIVNELNGEKIDVVMWNPDPAVFIANALSPAHIVSVELNKSEEVATAAVPDKQLSLAIGKEGQNARLAAKLTGWRIDIKSASAVEAQKLALAKTQAETLAAAETKEEAAIEEVPAEIPAEMEPALVSAEPPAKEMIKSKEPVTGRGEAEGEKVPVEVFFEPKPVEKKPQIRFAEDILVSKMGPPAAKPKKKKKKGTFGKESAEDGIRLKKARRGGQDIIDVDVDEEEY